MNTQKNCKDCLFYAGNHPNFNINECKKLCKSEENISGKLYSNCEYFLPNIDIKK